MIKLLSASDSLSATKRKMEDWIANGVLLGWLIDPCKRTVFVYAPNVSPLTFIGDTIHGIDPIAGFCLDLTEVWRCYE